MRFDPDHVLPAGLEYHDWRPARWPAGPRSWRLRRAVGRFVDRLADAFRNFADFVHGQPHVSVRINFAALPPRQVNRFEPLRPLADEKGRAP